MEYFNDEEIQPGMRLNYSWLPYVTHFNQWIHIIVKGYKSVSLLEVKVMKENDKYHLHGKDVKMIIFEVERIFGYVYENY